MAKTGKKKSKSGAGSSTIALNKKARHDYTLSDRLEAGIALEGWEAKSLRAGKVQMVDSYILLKNNEAFLFGCLITPLPTASTHIKPDPRRTRKLLMHRHEIDRLIGAAEIAHQAPLVGVKAQVGAAGVAGKPVFLRGGRGVGHGPNRRAAVAAALP